ncbi:MAG: hypothetical protein JW893_09740 [Candidatus Omnitrophica bacterium]|nr:hypothetical protein [Candidatus Omnitrophota bacterium]
MNSEFIGGLMFVAGVVMSIVGQFMLICAAFSKSILWGLSYLFIPGIGPLIFILRFWRQIKGPLLIFFVSLCMLGGGAFMTIKPLEDRHLTIKKQIKHLNPYFKKWFDSGGEIRVWEAKTWGKWRPIRTIGEGSVVEVSDIKIQASGNEPN